jgi:uncharacterized protein involved in outer membrane biogenesis
MLVRFLKGITGCFLIVFLMLVGIVTLVDPNQFKPIFSAYLQKKTGGNLIIHGPILWQMDPTLSLEAYDLSLEKTEKTAETLTVKKLRLQPNLWAILSGKWWTDVSAEGLILYLDQAITVSHQGTLNAKWIFNQKSSDLIIQDFKVNANTDQISLGLLTGELHITTLPHHPIITGTLQLLNTDLKPLLSVFNLPVHAAFSKATKLSATFKFQSPTLEVSSFNLSLEDNGIIEGAFSTNFPITSFNTLNLTADVVGKKLRIGWIPVDEWGSHLEIKDKVLDFSKMHTKITNTLHQGKLKIDFNNATPHIYGFDQMSSTNIQNLLALFNKSDKLSGRIEMEASFTTEGTNLTEWRDNILGKAHVVLTDGKLYGIHLAPLLQHAYTTVSNIKTALQKKEKPNITALLTAELGEWKQQAIHFQDLQTPFQLLETDLILENGKITTPILKLFHPDYTIQGNGSIDLNQQTAEYQLSALLKRQNTRTPLSIRVQGPMTDLAVSPDLARYTNTFAPSLPKQKPVAATVKPSVPAPMSPEHELEKLFGLT